MGLKREDIPILNSLLDQVLKHEIIYTYLRQKGNIVIESSKESQLIKGIVPIVSREDDNSSFPTESNPSYSQDIGRYVKIIDHYEAAEIVYPAAGSNGSISVDFLKTKDFLENNEFQKILDRQQEEKELQRIESEKLRTDATVSKWTKKTYWWVFIASLIALGLSLYNFISRLFD